MPRRSLLVTAILLLSTLPASAQLPWQFQWKKDQRLTYKIKHTTSVIEVVDGKTNTSSSKLDLVNRWEVSDLDDKGVATVSMRIIGMRSEHTRGNGATLFFDSEDLEKSTPELRDQMKKYIGAVHAVLRVDGYGRVIEVKQGLAKTFEEDPPFIVVFPAAKASEGQAWRRTFKIALDPPYGTGEKFDAEQRYDCKTIKAGKATLGVATTFKTMPDNANERVPLLQKESQGEIVFDLPRGILLSARMNIDKMVENHQGKGSSYRFKSDYVRELLE